jgi:ATP-dependent Clp protease ATP-binding subunit ClpC
MVNILSERAQHVLGLARDEALRLHHEYIGTEHILLGIAREPDGVVANTFKSFGITLDRVRSGVESIVGIGPPAASPDDRGISPRAKHVLEFSDEEAGHYGSPLVEPEHLLLGVTREAHGVAAQVLRDLQVSPQSVREHVLGLLGRGDMREVQDT